MDEKKLGVRAKKTYAEVNCWGAKLRRFPGAQWQWREWILDAAKTLDSLPHRERLELTDFRGLLIPRVKERRRLETIAKFMRKRVEHVDYRYFTMPS